MSPIEAPSLASSILSASEMGLKFATPQIFCGLANGAHFEVPNVLSHYTVWRIGQFIHWQVPPPLCLFMKAVGRTR